MAELADAQASGACGSNIVWVQVPSPALTGKSVNGFLFYFVQIILKAYWLLMVCNRWLPPRGVQLSQEFDYYIGDGIAA